MEGAQCEGWRVTHRGRGRQDISKHFSQLVTREGIQCNKEERAQRDLGELGACLGNLFEIIHTFLFA